MTHGKQTVPKPKCRYPLRAEIMSSEKIGNSKQVGIYFPIKIMQKKRLLVPATFVEPTLSSQNIVVSCNVSHATPFGSFIAKYFQFNKLICTKYIFYLLSPENLLIAFRRLAKIF